MALGRYYWQGKKAPDGSDYEMARREFEFAKRSLPNDAEIESALGRIDRDEGKWDEAITHLERAASLDPNTPERWHRLFATYEHCRDFPAAAQALERAIALAPNPWPFMQHRAFLQLFWKGDLSEMKNLPPPPNDPDGVQTWSFVKAKLCLRQFDEAAEILRQDPHENLPAGEQVVPKIFLLGMVSFMAGDTTAASAFFETARSAIEKTTQEYPPGDSRHLLQAQLYAGLGLNAQALAELKPVEAKRLDFSTVHRVAEIYAMLGDAEHATPLLQHLLSIRSFCFARELRVSPRWDPIRDDLRFQKLAAQADVVFPANHPLVKR